MHLKSGTLLQGGKYRIEKALGQGGFGITYLAVQSGLNRKVAIKEFFMKEHCNRDADTSGMNVPSIGSKELVSKFKSKFIKEAQTISGLESHHIIRIIEVFEENGTAYYVMEYLSCGSLAERIPSDGLPESVALDYIRQICDALSYIHESKILHLDIKPSNILFRKNDEAVLIDFGISKHYDDEDGGQTSSTPVGVSEGYAPTEQYEREGVSSFSASTDIYALGATLYCLLCGHRPPKASIVLNDGLPSLPSSVSASTRAAVAKAMEPRRKDRPQSVADFLALLPEKEVTELDPEPGSGGKNSGKSGNAPSGVKPDDKKPERKSPKRIILSIAAVLLLCLMGYGIWYSVGMKINRDLSDYITLMDIADSLVRATDYEAAINACNQAVEYEERYSDTKYSQVITDFGSAKELLTQIDSLTSLTQEQVEEVVDPITVAESSIKENDEQERERLAKEEAERERLEQERLAKEEENRRRNVDFWLREAAEQERLENEESEMQRLERLECEHQAHEEAERELENERQAQEEAERQRLEQERLLQEETELDRLDQQLLAREEAERKRNTVSYSNGILNVKGIEYPMVYVAGGSFAMGSEDSDADSYEKPVHRVTLTSYRIGQYEVTQDIWEAVMGTNPSEFKGSRRPVENVSWKDCQEFIRKLNILTGQDFKLPTEAQWEFAARGGNNSLGYKYSGLDNIASVAWYGDNSGGTTHDVGTKSSNELGIYDMSGNVYEWCSDKFGHYRRTSQSDPNGPSMAYGSPRIFRGGSWFSSAGNCRVSFRNGNFADQCRSYLGFRICL